MAGQSFNPATPARREWLTALRALRRLLQEHQEAAIL
jgi:ribosomal protein L19E